jgi:hypothetical protein
MGSVPTMKNIRFRTQLHCTPVLQVAPKVPASAWKWPNSWPFPVDFLELTEVTPQNQTVLSPAVINTFQQHIQNTLFDGATILELGDSKTSFLSACETKKNTLESFELSKVEKTLPYASNTFDRIIISSGIESLSDPRQLFRDIWRVLKPGGTCITCFSGKIYSPYEKSAKMWTTMNDEQKIWIAGSYYHYSAGMGWEGIEGYDLLGSTGEQKMIFEKDANGLETSAYVVSAAKILIPTMDSPDFSAYNYSKTSLLGYSSLDRDDLEFTALRIDSEFRKLDSSLEKQSLLDSIPKLPSIYEILKTVKEVVIPTPVKAMLAIFLLPKWENTVPQKEALKLGLGLEKADEDFWGPLGLATGAMPPREKILFLSEIIPEFGTNPNLVRLPDLLSKLLIRIKEKLPLIEEASIQIFVADLAVTDFLLDIYTGDAAFDRIVKFVDISEPEYLNTLISERMLATLK